MTRKKLNSSMEHIRQLEKRSLKIIDPISAVEIPYIYRQEEYKVFREFDYIDILGQTFSITWDDFHEEYDVNAPNGHYIGKASSYECAAVECHRWLKNNDYCNQ